MTYKPQAGDTEQPEKKENRPARYSVTDAAGVTHAQAGHGLT